ncbi:MAG: PaaI family thioesterase [Bacteroidetes bacterium]|nr:PaaI family thioesterase [Bacteroidota bacterium]HET6245855.1 PaaI family thioesterase [Bacteroidia bacterium]
MDRLLEIYNKINKYGEVNGMKVHVIEPGHIVYEMEIKDQHMATPIAAHGGAVAGFMDGVLGVAALSASAQEENLVSTIEFKINFLNPVYKSDILIGTGRVEQKGKRIIIASGEIVCKNRNNILIAKAIGTFNAYPFEKADFVNMFNEHE